MRSKLVSFNLLRVDEVLPIGDRIFSVLSACSVLKEVELLVTILLPDALMHRLFESLKSVTTLTCFVSRDVNPDKVIIDAMAGNLTNLESLTISTSELLTAEDVNGLVGLPHLKSVTIRRRVIKKPISKEPETFAVAIVKMLKDCAQLMQLEIVDINLQNRSLLIAEAAVMYKREDSDMYIGGVQYWTW